MPLFCYLSPLCGGKCPRHWEVLHLRKQDGFPGPIREETRSSQSVQKRVGSSLKKTIGTLSCRGRRCQLETDILPSFHSLLADGWIRHVWHIALKLQPWILSTAPLDRHVHYLNQGFTSFLGQRHTAVSGRNERHTHWKGMLMINVTHITTRI